MAVNEGGAEEFLDVVRKSYEHNNASERLQITYYPKFVHREKLQQDVPLYGLSLNEFYIDCSMADVPDHSLRSEVYMPLLKKAFTLQVPRNDPVIVRKTRY